MSTGRPTVESSAGEASVLALEQAMRVAAKRLFSVPRTAGAPIDRSGHVALAHLATSGELRLSDLAAALELDASTVSRQVGQLVRAGLVSRRDDPADRRASLLAATEAGSALHADLRRRRVALLDQAMAGWSSADRTDFVRLVEQLGDSLLAMGITR
jgi:DNA-binding MarR family transcriptional regulator